MQQADGDRFDVVAASGSSPARSIGSSSSPSGAEAAPHLEAQVALDERRRPVGERVVERRTVLARDLDDVGEALVRDERDGGARPLEQGVRGDGRAVGEHRAAARSLGLAERIDGRRRTAAAGSSGVDGTLATVPSSATASVNVPPVSTPTRTRGT